METIPHRELRNNSSKILVRVAAGESLAVTNHGEVAALLVPPRGTELQRLQDAGRVRPAKRRDVRFTQLPRVIGASSQEILDDVRGRW